MEVVMRIKGRKPVPGSLLVPRDPVTGRFVKLK